MTSYKIYYPNIYRQMSGRSSLFVDLPERFRCTLCYKIMIEPVQTECGCRFCLHCIESHKNQFQTHCPSCKQENIKIELIKDTAVEKEMMNLKMNCINEECKKFLMLKELNEHLVICDYKKEQCDKCDQFYSTITKQKHIEKDCIKTMIMCPDCGKEMTREELINQHKNYEEFGKSICWLWIAECPYKCNEEKLVNIRIHISNCPKKPEECPFTQFGCEKKGSQEFINFHINKDSTIHDVLMMSEIKNLRTINDEIKKSYIEKEEKLIINLKNEQEIKESTSILVENLKLKVEELEATIKLLSCQLNTLQSEPRNGFITPSKNLLLNNGHATWIIKDIRKKINESKLGNSNQLTSEHFYLKHPGYNMTMKVYLNGDGCAINKYLSAYFVINKGKYDNQISWPFKSKVILSLLSNNQSKDDINVHMRPDNNVLCYQRPSNDYNIGAGKPEFASLSEIMFNDNYLHDGALKLRLSL